MLTPVTLTPAQRITLINESATLLDKRHWAEIDLILEQHSMPVSEFGNWEDQRSYVIEMIKRAEDEDLRGLHAYLTGESDHSAPGQSPFSGGKVRVFMSHLAAHRDLVGQAGQRLSYYGIEAFVAHDSIEPSNEWQQVIEAALADCDAMVVFLHEGFRNSNWCDQEVGWALGRRRPLLPLSFDQQPYGFMGKYQSLRCAGQSGWLIGDAVAKWLVKVPTLHSGLAESLSHAFRNSPSWDFTRSLVPLLEEVASFTEDQLARIEEAARDNVDVRDCNINGVSGPDWTRTFVASRRGQSVM